MATTVVASRAQSGECAPRRAVNFEEPRILVWALLVGTLSSIWLVFASVKTHSLYVENYGYFYDPAAYCKQYIELYQQYLNSGAWTTLLGNLAANDRCPLRTLPYLIFAPKLLASYSGHLWTAVPFLFSFLTLLCATVYKRTNSVLWALAATSVFVGMPFHYDPLHGISAFWLDLTSSLALGCAVLCLIRFGQSGNATKAWMLAFGAFASTCVLCRWGTVGYLLAVAAPAFPVALITRHGVRSFQWRAAIASCSFALIGCMPGLIFVGYFFPEVARYYGIAGYAFNAPIISSMQWAGSTLIELLGMPILAGLVLAWLINVAGIFRTQPSQAGTNLIGLWSPVSVFVFVCFISKAYGGHHPLFYFAPALVVAAGCALPAQLRAPLPDANASWLHSQSLSVSKVVFQLVLPGLILAACIASSISSYEHFRHLAKSPPPAARLQKQTDVALGKLIVSSKARTFLEFDTQTIYPQLEAFYGHGWYCKESPYFSIHGFHMTGLYPKQTPEQVAKSVYKDVKDHVDLVAVFADANQADAPGLFSNAYTRTVSRFVSERVPADQDEWCLVGTVNSPRGLLSVYRRKSDRVF